MRKTLFAGLTVLDPDESLLVDGAAFIGRDRDRIDHFLELGAKTHRHNGLTGLADPTDTLASAYFVGSGGSIGAGRNFSFGYTVTDSENGETLLSDTLVASTPDPMDPPNQGLIGSADYGDGGNLLVDTYYYAESWVDDSGGETPVGAPISIERQPGYAHARIQIGGLASGMQGASATGWRLYRATGGGEYSYLASGVADYFADDGSMGADCDVNPLPGDVNTTNGDASLVVKLPSASGPLADQDATLINVYVSEDGTFTGDVLLDSVPVGSAGHEAVYRNLNDIGSQQPPDVSTSIGGANLIDPDTELLDWHWKRAVTNAAALPSGVQGDVRMALDTGQVFAMLHAPSGGPGEWQYAFAGGSAIGVVAASGDGSVSGPSRLMFAASGTLHAEAHSAGGSAVVSIAPGPRIWASAVAPALGSGASASLDFGGSAAGGRLLKVSTSKRSRVRVYGDDAARIADLARAIGTDPTGDHGVILDYAMTTLPSGGMGRISPAVDAHNLDAPAVNKFYLNVTNYDATGDVVVAFLYLPTEVV